MSSIASLQIMRDAERAARLSQFKVLGALALLCSVSCGKATHSPSEDGGVGASGGAAGSGTAGSGTASGGTAGGGTGAGAGQAGSAAVTAALPNATEDERAILEPLFIPPAELEAAEMAQLIEMGASIGFARGYAMCRCAGVITEDIMSCAAAETGVLGFTRARPGAAVRSLDQDFARCLQEASLVKPWLADALRCQLLWYQEDGRAWLDLCSLPGFEAGDGDAYPQTPRRECPGADQAAREELERLLVLQCREVTYCDDGTRVSPGRCNGTLECVDESDEHSCYDLVGYDMVQCGQEVQNPWKFCSVSGCGAEIGLPVCGESPGPLHCPDGTALSADSVCNRTNDCADGADELHCFR